MRATDSLKQVDRMAAAWVFRCQSALSVEEEKRLEEWRAADPAHAAAFERHSESWSAFQRPADSERFLTHLARRAKSRMRRRLLTASAALSLLGLLGLGGYFLSKRGSAAENRWALVQPTTQILTDGSIVQLKPGAQVRIDFSPNLRHVFLSRGGAHFQVAKDASRPFVVAAAEVDFRAVGTAFSVDLGAENVDLLVTEGRVSVEKQNPASPVAFAATVDAGKQLSVTRSATILPSASEGVSAEAMAERLAWRAPRLEFTDLPLSDAVRLMNRYGTLRLVIDDPALNQLVVSGLFRADRAEAFAGILQYNFGVSSERVGNAVLLRRARQD